MYWKKSCISIGLTISLAIPPYAWANTPAAPSEVTTLNAAKFLADVQAKNPALYEEGKAKVESAFQSLIGLDGNGLIDLYGELLVKIRTEEAYKLSEDEWAHALAQMSAIEYIDERTPGLNISKEAYEKTFGVGAPFEDAEFIEASAAMPSSCVLAIIDAILVSGILNNASRVTSVQRTLLDLQNSIIDLQNEVVALNEALTKPAQSLVRRANLGPMEKGSSYLRLAALLAFGVAGALAFAKCQNSDDSENHEKPSTSHDR